MGRAADGAGRRGDAAGGAGPGRGLPRPRRSLRRFLLRFLQSEHVSQLARALIGSVRPHGAAAIGGVCLLLASRLGGGAVGAHLQSEELAA